MHYNKKMLQEKIANLETAIEMEKVIRGVVLEFKHYKQVNSKFTDALDKRGLRAYICKDKWSSVLNISKPNRVDYYFRLYHSEITERRPFTWEGILNELGRYSYERMLEETKKDLESFEKERQELKDLYEHVEKINFRCFDLYKFKRELEDAIKISENQS
jgi:hypothetical protein